MDSNSYPGKRVYEALGFKDGPEYQDRDLNTYLESFLKAGRKSTYEAFAAMREIAVNQVHQDGDLASTAEADITAYPQQMIETGSPCKSIPRPCRAHLEVQVCGEVASSSSLV